MADVTVSDNALLDNLAATIAQPELRDLRAMLATMLNRAMQYEVAQKLQAEHYEHTADRLGHRNGTRPRRFDTGLGTFHLAVPRMRAGGYVPAFLESRSRSERALVAAVQEAMLHGVSTRKMEKLMAALGIESLSKSQVSDLCAELDAKASAFRTRPLTARYPYLLLDAMYEHVRIDRAVISQAVVVAYGVREDGIRDILGVDVVQSESTESWTTFLRSLTERGLTGVRLVTSDAHTGLKAAAQSVLAGSSWQRCKVHFMRNVLAHVTQKRKAAIGAELSGIFTQQTLELAQKRSAEVIAAHRGHAEKAMGLLEDDLGDALSYYAFPTEHHRKISSTNPVEHLNRDIRRRTRLVGIFPNVSSALRLISLVLLEQTEDWSTERRYMNPDSLASLYQ